MSNIAVDYYRRADRAIKGWPDSALTIILLAVAGICVYLAFSPHSLWKGVAVAWLVLP